jgi:hypothetical protein
MTLSGLRMVAAAAAGVVAGAPAAAAAAATQHRPGVRKAPPARQQRRRQRLGRQVAALLAAAAVAAAAGTKPRLLPLLQLHPSPSLHLCLRQLLWRRSSCTMRCGGSGTPRTALCSQYRAGLSRPQTPSSCSV